MVKVTSNVAGVRHYPIGESNGGPDERNEKFWGTMV